MHSKRKSHPKLKNWWLVKRFSKHGYIKLAEAATVETLQATKKRFYSGWPTRIVQAK